MFYKNETFTRNLGTRHEQTNAGWSFQMKEKKKNFTWWNKIRKGLGLTSNIFLVSISSNLMGLFTRQKHCKSGTDSMPKCILIANFQGNPQDEGENGNEAQEWRMRLSLELPPRPYKCPARSIWRGWIKDQERKWRLSSPRSICPSVLVILQPWSWIIGIKRCCKWNFPTTGQSENSIISLD